ncbi:hypothetical protein GGX14DRAFT_391478 [Mycena pura]|uniref:Uncharacterized protein n=1 Tax=Mycena pura TaxID=153505 RepID=A0AAD6VKM2_9AGAR|nr:hypothetical protein GGX14DRAFT_391478 [Mycena pura]
MSRKCADEAENMNSEAKFDGLGEPLWEIRTVEALRLGNRGPVITCLVRDGWWNNNVKHLSSIFLRWSRPFVLPYGQFSAGRANDGSQACECRRRRDPPLLPLGCMVNLSPAARACCAGSQATARTLPAACAAMPKTWRPTSPAARALPTALHMPALPKTHLHITHDPSPTTRAHRLMLAACTHLAQDLPPLGALIVTSHRTRARLMSPTTPTSATTAMLPTTTTLLPMLTNLSRRLMAKPQDGGEEDEDVDFGTESREVSRELDDDAPLFNNVTSVAKAVKSAARLS